MNTNTIPQPTKPSAFAQLIGGALGAMIVGTIEDHTKK